MEIALCKCGGVPEFVKLYESKRYDGFVRCPKCGAETPAYTSKQNAVRRWNRMEYHVQTVKIGIKKDSELYKRIERHAVKEGVSVEAVIDAAVSLRGHRGIVAGLDVLESQK